MKITIDARGKEVEALARAGLLKGAKILERTALKRRQLSRKTEATLQIRLDRLRVYKDQFGSFDVPRSGAHEDLGDWLDKLKETYIKAPDGYRIRYLREHGKDLLAYLSNWASTKVSKTPIRNAPFWLSAAWVADFMRTYLNAPSQASAHPDEVAMARWLSRWTSGSSMQKLQNSTEAYFIAGELDDLAQMLRSRDPADVDEARDCLRTWSSGLLYGTIASMCDNDRQWMTVRRRKKFKERVMMGDRFWPTWTEWKREAAVWVEKSSEKRQGPAG